MYVCIYILYMKYTIGGEWTECIVWMSYSYLFRYTYIYTHDGKKKLKPDN